MARRRALAIAVPRRCCRSHHLYPLPMLASLLFHSGLRHGYRIYLAGRGRTSDRSSIGRSGSWSMGNARSYVASYVILFGASLMMFGAGYPFGIFRARRLLGMTLRETALNF